MKQQQPFTKVILLNKPFHVLCQFSPHENKKTLADYLKAPNYYPAGRLDYDSEGLLVLTDNGKLQSLISHPRFKLPKTYWVQVEGSISDTALNKLQRGVELKDGMTAPAQVHRISEPSLWPRNPPIRHRATIPTSWLELTISEGRNRQVRRMTAAVGFPTLRLIRARIGQWNLDDLEPGQWQYSALPEAMQQQLDKATPKPAYSKAQQRPARPPKHHAGKSRPTTRIKRRR